MTVDRKRFDEDRLVYIPSRAVQPPACWVSPLECVWSGPDSLKRTPRLKDLWPEDISEFFQDILAIKDATFQTLLSEMEELTDDEAAPLLAQLFQDADKLAGNGLVLLSYMARQKSLPGL
jgi:hypothetical protein